ncbi:hypothetical protein WSK_4317 [Novosphingobium sp. Rr 2-17]|uniref:hypothetical protein n=1 Tax=Novosphingobium sp. Rr 2-17 TaxID=555793 RepID=UPI0002697F18|nr:hypothetical protein [Novosphingobium sp. Rr 2-17]EIZ77111.1 hypothetical protein WSK_4317 [Novosphingobium sp. Rr 2-17]
MIWHPAYIEARIRELFLKNRYCEIEPPEVRWLMRARMSLPRFYDDVAHLVLSEHRGWTEIAELFDISPRQAQKSYYLAMKIIILSRLRQERKGW